MSLTDPVQRYLDFMQVSDRECDESFGMRWTGRFRLGPKDRWMRCRVVQRNTSAPLARAFRMDLRLFGVLPARAEDIYDHGHGHMRVHLLGVIPMVDAAGPELDAGELVTWLNDAVLFAPTMLKRVAATWRSIDDHSFDVTLADNGQSVRGRVSIDARGAPLDFSTTDRFVRDPFDRRAPWRRTRWTTPVAGWRADGGRPRPMAARAVWHLPQGDFTYAEMDMQSAVVEYGTRAVA